MISGLLKRFHLNCSDGAMVSGHSTNRNKQQGIDYTDLLVSVVCFKKRNVRYSKHMCFVSRAKYSAT